MNSYLQNNDSRGTLNAALAASAILHCVILASLPMLKTDESTPKVTPEKKTFRLTLTDKMADKKEVRVDKEPESGKTPPFKSNAPQSRVQKTREIKFKEPVRRQAPRVFEKERNHLAKAELIRKKINQPVVPSAPGTVKPKSTPESVAVEARAIQKVNIHNKKVEGIQGLHIAFRQRIHGGKREMETRVTKANLKQSAHDVKSKMLNIPVQIKESVPESLAGIQTGSKVRKPVEKRTTPVPGNPDGTHVPVTLKRMAGVGLAEEEPNVGQTGATLVERNHVVLASVEPRKPTSVAIDILKKEGEGVSEGERRRILSSFSKNIQRRIAQNQKYPPFARKLGYQGRTVVAFKLGRDGRVVSLEVATSSGHDILDDAAVQAIQEAAPYESIPDEIDEDVLLFKLPITFKLE